MSQTNPSQEIILSVLSVVPAEKIFVLATTKSEHQTESIFTKSSFKKSKTTHLYLLVLISTEQNCIYTEKQNEIESVLDATVIAMEMEMFNQWLGEGHPFAIQTKINAQLIYDHKQIPLAAHALMNEEKLFVIRKDIYQSGIEKMKQIINENNFHAASVEGLMTILKATIGLELQINNIDQLIDYCTIVIKEMPEIFSENYYDNNPPIEKIQTLLNALYAPYKLMKIQELNIL